MILVRAGMVNQKQTEGIELNTISLPPMEQL